MPRAIDTSMMPAIFSELAPFKTLGIAIHKFRTHMTNKAILNFKSIFLLLIYIFVVI